jgi:hypothetical protein
VSQDGSADITFAFPMSANLTAEFVGTGGVATDSHCAGSSQNPTAEAGYLCVYSSYSENVSFACVTETDVTWICNSGGDHASKYGASPYITAVGAGRTVSVGTWAATAPTGATKHQASRKSAGGRLPAGTR